jgi:hypothetical protein
MKFFTSILFLLFTASTQAFEPQVLKYAADKTETPPSEVSQYVRFGLVSSIQYSDEVNISDMANAATAAGIDLSDFKRVDIIEWNLDIPRPTQEDLDAVADVDLVNRPASHALYQDGIWVARPAEEIQAEAESARQLSKPIEQRQYENTFFSLTEQLLTALDDPRAGQEPPVKLSFPEIDAILEQLFEVDLATATRASIKLLGIDAALKRYNTLWWDDAIQHELPEE